MHAFYGTRVKLFFEDEISINQYVELHPTKPLTVVDNINCSNTLGVVSQKQQGSALVEVVLNGVDAALDEYERQLTASVTIGAPISSVSTTATPGSTSSGPVPAPTKGSIPRTHPEYGQSYWFDNPDRLTTGTCVKLVSGSWSAVEGVKNTKDMLGYIIVIVGGSGGRVLVKLNGSDAVLDDFVQRYKIAHPNITNPIAVPTGGIPAGGGSDGGTGGGGSVSVTLGKQSTDTILAGGGSGGGAGGGGLLDNDTFNKLIDHRAWIFPEWSCKCPYCPERPPTKHVKAPTCYTCGDKMSPV